MIISDKKSFDMMFQLYRDQLIHNPNIDPDDWDDLTYAAGVAEKAVAAFLKASNTMNGRLATQVIDDMLDALNHHNIQPNWSEEKADA